MRHPEFAAAYILQDWKRNGNKAVRAITDAVEVYEYRVSEPYYSAPEVEVAEVRIRECINSAIARLEVYVQALKDARDTSE